MLVCSLVVVAKQSCCWSVWQSSFHFISCYGWYSLLSM